jgi:hypothetical protein
MQKAYSAIASEGASMMNDALNKYGLAYTYDLAKDAYNINVKKEEKLQSLKNHAEQMNMERARLEQSAAAERSRAARDERRLNMEQERLNLQRNKDTFKADDVAQYLDSKGVHISDKAERKAVQTSVSSMAELKDLKDEVARNPGLVGRQGQIKQFTDKYLNSFKTGEPVDESKVSQADQEALLFAKKYASMLTRYEQGLAGSGRSSSTVFFQKRYNDLLSQDQFNPASMGKLFEDMQFEMARTAGKASPKLTYGLMDEMAEESRGRLSSAPFVSKPAAAPAQSTPPKTSSGVTVSNW